MREPVRIFSDLHLGHKVSRITRTSALRPLISGAGTVIFNGDTWQELAEPFYDRSVAMLEELRGICAQEGAEAVFLSGNHDPGWPGPGWLELADGKIVVTHGDALLFDGSPWKREILIGGQRVMETWAKHPLADHNIEERIRVAREIARTLCSVEHPIGRHFLLRAWDAAKPPKRAIKMLEAWFGQATAGDRFCERYFPRAEALVIGHFHFQGCWRRGQRIIINTGSFVSPGRAHWVEWKNGWLTRGEILESSAHCQLGRQLGSWRF